LISEFLSIQTRVDFLNVIFIVAVQILLAMSRKDYRSLTLPAGLYLELEKFVAQFNGYYVSVAEVVREALRDYLRKQHEE
jgi:hypothetical protein